MIYLYTITTYQNQNARDQDKTSINFPRIPRQSVEKLRLKPIKELDSSWNGWTAAARKVAGISDI